MIEGLLVKIARGLDAKGIPYMVIGGQAVLVYGIPRLTEDIDITLGADVKMLSQMGELCASLGLRRLEKADDEFVKKTNVLICEDSLTGIRIDFIFSFLDYERQAIKHAKEIDLKRYKVRFASCEDLIIHKMFAGRGRDLEDIRGLLSRTKDSLNIKYINKWLTSFAQMPEFADIQQKWDQLLNEMMA